MTLKILRAVRPSNLVLLAAAPFIIYLFAFTSKYTRSLVAIIGVEPNSGMLFVGFLFFLALGTLAGIPWYQSRFGAVRVAPEVVAPVAMGLHLVLVAYLVIQPAIVVPFVNSLVANSVDPFTSDWIVATVRPRQLMPEVSAIVLTWLRTALVVYGVAVAGLTAAALFAGGGIAMRARWIMGGVAIALLFYLGFFAHWGFANGVAITFRAAIFAYILAAIIGLCWTGLTMLKQKRRTILVYGAISLALLAAAAFFFAQPRETYVLVGSTEARIAIIKGTPQGLSDSIRFGEYPGANGKTLRIRSTSDAAAALALIQDNDNVSGAFIPTAANPGDMPLLWEASFLPPGAQVPALTLSVLGLLLGVFTIGAQQHGLHPLAVGAEFFVDTIRGIPMLVIILYIGLPLSGAVKEISGGGIDLSNMTRGVIAIAIGYSAYMAEIFRAGIEAVPIGQVEASAALGMRRWHTARFIVLPQALKVVIPPLGNEFIAMIKDTSLLSILSVRDITQRMREFQASSFLPFAPFNTAAIVYVVITLAAASFLKWIERRYDVK